MNSKIEIIKSNLINNGDNMEMKSQSSVDNKTNNEMNKTNQ